MKFDLHRMTEFRDAPNQFHSATLSDNTPVVMRPLRAEDDEKLVQGLETLSYQSRYQRFLYNKHAFTPSELDYLSACDGIDHLALGLALSDSEGSELQAIAIARCIRDGDDSTLAEVAIVVADEWQGKGAGKMLLQALAEWAWNVGIRRWQALLLNNNTAAFKLMEVTGTKLSQQPQGPGITLVTYALSPPSNFPGESNPYHLSNQKKRRSKIPQRLLLLVSLLPILVLLVLILSRKKPA